MIRNCRNLQTHSKFSISLNKDYVPYEVAVSDIQVNSKLLLFNLDEGIAPIY
jgi:hypothetical protein